MISTNKISKQFSSKPLFEDINITFTKGNKYGLIGANGSGKSTFMKILSGEIESTNGSVAIDKKYRVATLKQDHFIYEDTPIIDCVIIGHKKLWDIKVERERLYSLEEMSIEESLKVSDLEIEFSDLNGYTDFNTYKISGLPPYPICHPGKSSIMAVLNPEDTDYLYFVADGLGGHVFAKTLRSHNKNVAKWRRLKNK